MSRTSWLTSPRPLATISSRDREVFAHVGLPVGRPPMPMPLPLPQVRRYDSGSRQKP